MELNKATDEHNQIEGKSVSFAFSKAASWPILHGRLDDTVICESSFSAVDSEANLSPKSDLLVLRRPSHDCGPCEIKISFEQKHEIRQVYVKSTARVYEIYCGADKQNTNEYLCTVRCGLAAKSDECVADEYLQNTDAVTSVSPSSTGSNKLLDEVKTESGGSTNEDGWVEIKGSDPSLAEDGVGSRSNRTSVCMERENQDFYEATAEISDAKPCTSITIRLLSIQKGDSVYLDEVYVFADPVDCDDDANSASNEVEHSAGNPLMAMLVPTLLQLSKSRMSQISKQPNPTSKSVNVEQDESQNISPASTSVNVQKNERPSVSNEHDKPGTNNRMGESSSDSIGKTLDQLVYRIARIEQFCLSFEQKMINPITSMDARLGEVEKQLKSLNEKFHLPETHSSTTTHVPDVSCNDSVLGQLHTGENVVRNGENEDCLSYEVPAPVSSVHAVVTAPEFFSSSVPVINGDGDGDSDETTNPDSNIRVHMVPSLVVTAPEFSYGEEEEEEGEENGESESVGNSPRGELKKPVSIDDALAGALAGFVSSTKSAREKDETNPVETAEINSEPKIEIIKGDDQAAENEENYALFCINSEPTGVHDFALNDSETETIETVATEEAENGNGLKDAKKFTKEDSGVLKDVLGLPTNSVVDYEIPILDVKFASCESACLSSSIEALLLSGTPGGENTEQDRSLEGMDKTEVRTLNADSRLDDLSHNGSSLDVGLEEQ